MKFKILIPVYNDWQSVSKLLDDINSNLLNLEHEISVIIIDDASNHDRKKENKNFENIHSIKILNMKINQGHARCIATGLKYIFEKASLYEIFFGRYFVAAILLFSYIKFRKQKVSLKTYYPVWTIIRVVLHFLAFSAFFISLTYMPLATANALFFSCPFFVSIFAKFFLKEFIGIRRWSAIVFGFIGVFIVLDPNFSDFKYKSLLPVVCAFFYAASMTITK